MLSQETCEACKADAPKVTDDELAVYMRQLPHWSGVSEDGILKLRREFTFSSYMDALAFTNRVAQLAESVNHHPDVLLE